MKICLRLAVIFGYNDIACMFNLPDIDYLVSLARETPFISFVCPDILKKERYDRLAVKHTFHCGVKRRNYVISVLDLFSKPPDTNYTNEFILDAMKQQVKN